MTRDFMTQQEVADFLGCSYGYVSQHLARLPGFPRHKVGVRSVVVPEQLRDWLYGHPAGIAWMLDWERRGRLNELDWDRLGRADDDEDCCAIV